MNNSKLFKALVCIALALAVVGLFTPRDLGEPLAPFAYQTKVYLTSGGDKMVVASGGELEILSGATADYQEGATYTLPAADKVALDGDTTNQTQTDGALDIDVGTTTADVSGFDVAVTADDGMTAGEDVFGGKITLTQNDADGDIFGLLITAAATTNAAAASYEYLASLVCAENTAGACTDGLLLTAGSTDTAMTDAIDASDTEIVNAINVGANLILGDEDDSVTIGATDDTLILKSNDATATFAGADAAGAADTIYDTTGAGTIAVGSADVTNVTVDSDVGLTFANNAESIYDGTDAAFDFTRDDAGVVTLTCSDDDNVAGCIYDAGGASPVIIGSGDVTNVSIDSDVGLTFVENSDSINNLADATFDFTRNDAGIVTLTASDNDGTADLTVDPGGAAALRLGSADVVSVTIQADTDIQLWNGTAGNVDLSFHDYADSADDDMAHALLRANCTDATSGGEDCDFTIGVVEGGAAADTRFMIDADAGVTIGSANSSQVALTAGTVTSTIAEPAAAGSGGDIWDITATFAAMDGSDTSLGLDMNLTGANATGTTNLLYGMDLDLMTADAQVTEKAVDLNDSDWDYAIDTGHVPIMCTAATWMDDFFGDTVRVEWVLLNGSDAQAVDPAIVANAQYGEVVLVSGDTNTNCAADCSEMNMGTSWSADQGSLVFEVRVRIHTTVTNASLCVGLTDVATIEAPAAITTTDTVTYVADDFVAFCFDDAADTDEWFALGRAGTTAATGNGATGVAPTADVYQVLRIEVDAGGADARFYIDGSLVKTLTADVITVTDLLAPFVTVDTNATSSVTVYVDYLFCSAQRQ